MVIFKTKMGAGQSESSICTEEKIPGHHLTTCNFGKEKRKGTKEEVGRKWKEKWPLARRLRNRFPAGSTENLVFSLGLFLFHHQVWGSCLLSLIIAQDIHTIMRKKRAGEGSNAPNLIMRNRSSDFLLGHLFLSYLSLLFHFRFRLNDSLLR